MSRFYVPTQAAHEWQWLLAEPGRQWKHEASAMSLANAWEGAGGWPARVAAALRTGDDVNDLELLLGLPEHQVPLPGGVRASQSDLFVIARRPDGGLVTIAVEGKAEEPFGDKTLEEWRAKDTPGRRERLAYLLGVLELEDDERLGAIRYQLLHRTASAVIEARRFGAGQAVMLVHSFSPDDSWFDDYAAFADLLGASAAKGQVTKARELDGVELHLGWVSDVPKPMSAQPALGPRFDRAFALARDLHADQSRKETELPYISHLMGVASLVLEDGGGEDEAIAALLHDAVEDQGGTETLKRIRHLFGKDVAAIVDVCSDTDLIPKPPWRERKEAYLAHLRDSDLPEGVLRVSLADKLHNARSILFDLRAGHDVFARFNKGREAQLWYYGALADAFGELSDSPMVTELRRVVGEIRHIDDPVSDSMSDGEPRTDSP